MKIAILIAAVCLLALIEVSFAATGIKVGPVTHGNCECKGVEIKDNRTQREFRLICKKTEVREVIEKKKKKKVTVVVWDTSCIYGGDPHPCKEYNKKQEQYYQSLLNVMSADFCDETLKKGECKDVTFKADKLCQNIKFTLNK